MNQENLYLKFCVGVKNYTLQKARIDKGLLQQDLAKLTGVSVPTICALENCRTITSDTNRKKIADVLEKKEEDLFPDSLKQFVKDWRDVNKQKVISVDTVSLSSIKDIGLLESGDEEKMIDEIDVELRDGVLYQSIVNNLTQKEIKIIKMRFGILGEKPNTLEVVAKYFAVSKERIRYLEAKAIEKIRQSNEGRILKKMEVNEEENKKDDVSKIVEVYYSPDKGFHSQGV